MRRDKKRLFDDLLFAFSLHALLLWGVDEFQLHGFAIEVLLSLANTIVTLYLCRKYTK